MAEEKPKSTLPRRVSKAMADLSPHLQRLREGKQDPDPRVRAVWEAIGRMNPGDALSLLEPQRNPTPAGAQPGQGKIDDSALLAEVAQLIAAGEKPSRAENIVAKRHWTQEMGGTSDTIERRLKKRRLSSK